MKEIKYLSLKDLNAPYEKDIQHAISEVVSSGWYLQGKRIHDFDTRLSDAVHILAFIALYPNCDLTSNKLAESIQTNPAYVRQLMSALRNGGLLVSVKGHPRPALAREPEKITLLDAYRAVEGNKPLLHQDIHTNPACGVGVNIQLVLRDFY